MASARAYLKAGDAVAMYAAPTSWIWDFERATKRGPETRVPVDRFVAKNLGRAFDQLEEKLALRLIVGGLREGAKVFKLAAQDGVPIRKRGKDLPKKVGRTGIRYPGYLRRGIIYRADPKRVAMRPVVRVGPRTTAFYGYFFETGRRARPMPIRRFMTKAFNRAHRPAIEATAARMREGLFKARGKYT